jgi:anti-anti-sigma regulatory factor
MGVTVEWHMLFDDTALELEKVDAGRPKAETTTKAGDKQGTGARSGQQLQPPMDRLACAAARCPPQARPYPPTLAGDSPESQRGREPHCGVRAEAVQVLPCRPGVRVLRRAWGGPPPPIPRRTASAPSEGMKIEIRQLGEVAIVTPIGMLINGDETDDLARQPQTLADHGNRKLLVDHGRARIAGNRALGILVRTWAHYRKLGGLMALCRVTHQDQRIFEIARLDQVFDICVTEEEALLRFARATLPGDPPP